MESTAPPNIVDLLLAKKLITPDQKFSLKLESARLGQDPLTIIKEQRLLPSRELASAVGELYNIPYHEIGADQIPAEVLDLVPEATAKKNILVPYAADAKTLNLEMADPLDLQTIDFIERRTGRQVVVTIGDPEDINRVIAEQYGRSLGKEVSATLEQVGATMKIAEGIADVNRVEETIRDAPVATMVARILEYAVKIKASDVHIEPEEKKIRIRYRVDGVLQEKLTINDIHVLPTLVARIKILAGMKIDEHRLPQDGRFKIEVGETETDLRVSTLPTALGEKVMIRLLKEEGKVLTLADLGLRGAALKTLQEGLLKSTGVIIVTGPTGSGKTVTQAACLTKLNTVRVNIVTLEDPVEIRVPGVNQVQMNQAIGLTFASGLRSVLRQDPNIIMVGEVRDSETAELAINAALTGHLVLTTLHTSSAAGAIPRLLDMGIENFLLASTVNVILAQRLVRILCPKCKKPTAAAPEIDTELKKTLGPLYHGQENQPAQIYTAAGCPECDNGYKGRLGIFEVLKMSEAISKLIMTRSSDVDIARVAVSEGMITMLQDGFLRVLDGTTTVEEIWRVAKD